MVGAAPAALRGDQLLDPDAAHAFREDADMVVVPIAVGAAAVADDVVVEHRLDLPALRLGIIGEDLAAEQPLLLAHQRRVRSDEHTSELQSLMRISYAVFCLKKNK